MAMEIIVTSIDGRSFRLGVLPWNNIQDVKQKIQFHHLIPMALQQLVFGEVQLEFNHTLNWYNIQNSANLTLIKLPIQVSFDEAKNAYRNIKKRSWMDVFDEPSQVGLSDSEESHYKYLRIVGKFFEDGEVSFRVAKVVFGEIESEGEENRYAQEWGDGYSTRPSEIDIASLEECIYKYCRIIGRFFVERIAS